MRAIGEPLTAEESAAFVAVCRSFMGVPFLHQGRNPEIGLDCAGMLQTGMRRIGRQVQDLTNYGREPHKDGLRNMLIANLGQPVPKASMRAGDIVLIRFHGAPRHVGLITQLADGRFGLLHVHSEMKFVAEHGIGERFGRLIVEVYRP